MTIDKFLLELEKTRGRDWQVWSADQLRDRSRDKASMRCCPIEAVYEHLFPNNGHVGYPFASLRLGLSDADTYKIVYAADKSTWHDPKLRTRLLAAVGLPTE